MSLSVDQIKSIRPLNGRVLVHRSDLQESVTPGGIVIPDQAKERAQIGTVIAVSEDSKISSGQQVFFGKYAGTEIHEEYLMLKEDEVLGVLS